MTESSMLLWTQVITTGLLAGVLTYFYSSARANYLRFWAIHWTIVAVLLLLSIFFPYPEGAPYRLGLSVLSVVGSAFLCFGALDISGRKVGTTWMLLVGAVIAWTAVATGPYDLPNLATATPVSWARGGLEIWAGILIFRLPGKFGTERFMTGIAFVAGGILVAGYPSLSLSDGYSPWDYLISTTIRLLAGVGMLLLFYQQARIERDAHHDRSVQSQRLEAMGSLAGGVAHDFNNVLTVIAGNAELLEYDVPKEGLDSLTAIQDAAQRATALTGQLLAFGRRKHAHPEPVNLAAALEGMESRLRSLVTKDINLTIDIDPAHGAVHIDPNHLDQIVMNLVANARDFVEAAGKIRISSREVSHPGAGSNDFPTLDTGTYVALAVTDDGCGMDAQTMKRVFEPLFTTKPKGQGKGLGLSTVHGMVGQAGGASRVESRLGVGTTFEIALVAATPNHTQRHQ